MALIKMKSSPWNQFSVNTAVLLGGNGDCFVTCLVVADKHLSWFYCYYALLLQLSNPRFFTVLGEWQQFSVCGFKGLVATGFVRIKLVADGTLSSSLKSAADLLNFCAEQCLSLRILLLEEKCQWCIKRYTFCLIRRY